MTVLFLQHAIYEGHLLTKFLGESQKKGRPLLDGSLAFKLHIIINEKGEILAYQLTGGSIDDRKPVILLVKECFGKLFGDKGYLSSNLFKQLYEQGVKLIIKLRSNMKNKLMEPAEKILLKSRGVIESVNNYLKNGCQIEHHHHRSILGFIANLLTGLIAYQLESKKPSIQLSEEEVLLLQVSS